MQLKNKKIGQFTAELASSAPVPGGGGTAALAGALAASLCSMAGNLTAGKKKYTEYEDNIIAAVADCAILTNRFLELMDEDAENFAPLAEAYSIPKNSPDRSSKIEKASLAACKAPLEIMNCCVKTIEIIEYISEHCGNLVMSDAACAASIAGSALESAAMNVFINTKGLKETCTAAANYDEDASALLSRYYVRARSVTERILSNLKGI